MKEVELNCPNLKDEAITILKYFNKDLEKMLNKKK